jgi:hypothetical protein
MVDFARGSEDKHAHSPDTLRCPSRAISLAPRPLLVFGPGLARGQAAPRHAL